MAKTKQPTIATQDRIPTQQKICYGAGTIVGVFSGYIVMEMFTPIFNIGMGISPVVIGAILMLYRLWDAITDVLMGNLSDNARTPWGRRRPFIIIGAVLTGFALPILWQASSDWSQHALIAYVVVTGLLLYTASTIWGMPYYSLGMELTPDYNERTRLTATRAIFEKAGGVVAGWMLALVSLPMFGDPVTGQPNLVNGMSKVAWILGLLVIVFGVLPGFFVKERYYAKEARNQKKIGLIESTKTTLSCRPFLLLMAVFLLQVIGTKMVSGLGLYLNIYYVNAGDIQAAGIIEGWKGTAMMVTGIISVPIWAWVAEKLGKAQALKLTVMLGFVANALVYFCFTPEHPYLQIIPSAFLSGFGSAIWMLTPSMQADIVDFDELQTGARREGSFSSVASWFYKFSMTLTVGISGLILAGTGFDVVKYGAAQPPEVLERMMAWYILLPMIAWVVALLLLNRYPLTHEAALNVRAKLEARRGVV